MERFFDGTGKFKTTRRKGTDQKNSKKLVGPFWDLEWRLA
jgi:hypothetical protein